MHTFYATPEQWGTFIELEGAEAHHAGTVLRLSEGEQVQILDGQGHVGLFQITRIKSKKLFLEQQSSELVARPLALPIIALAFSKAVRRDFFIEKAAELGAHAVWIWQGERSQGKVSRTLESSLLKQMIAGIKQSGNPWLPEVHVLSGGVEELIARAQSVDYRILPWELQNSDSMLSPSLLGREGKTLYVIGPEGGFSERELDALNNNAFSKVSLGSRILRCETAATLCLGLHWWASHLPRQGQER